MIRRSLILLLLSILLPWARGEAQCKDLAKKLAEPEVPVFASLEGCGKQFAAEHEALLTNALTRALQEKNWEKVERLAALWQQIHSTYLPQRDFQSNTVPAAFARSLKSDPIRKALGGLQPAFVVNPAGESMADSVNYLLYVAQRLRDAVSPAVSSTQPSNEIAGVQTALTKIEAAVSHLERQRFWSIAALVASGLALLLAGAAVWRARPNKPVTTSVPMSPPRGELEVLSDRVSKVEEGLTPKALAQTLSGLLQYSQDPRFPALATLHQDLETERAARSAALGSLAERLNTVERAGGRREAVEIQIPATPPPFSPTHSPPPPRTNPLEVVEAAELEILRAALGQVTGSSSPWPELLDDLAQLPAQLERYPDLQGASQEAVAPVRSYIDLAARLRLAQKLAAGSAPRLEPAKELLRLRETIQILVSLRPPRTTPEWRHDTFVEGGFREFADLFFQTLQRERFEGRDLPLAVAAKTVRKTLVAAGLEVVEIELGRDLFDPARHIGRGTSTLTNLQDGAITGVVRNGFRRLEGRTVIQLPEVIVNRIS